MSEQKTRPVFKVIGIGLIGLFFVTLFSEKNPEPVKPEQSSHANATPQVMAAKVSLMKPESLVIFPDSSIACLSKKALSEVTAHFLKGEKTKAKAYFISEKNADGQCLMLDPKRKFKVLSVEYNNPETPDFGIMEVVGEGSDSASGAWVFTAGAVAQ